MRSFLLTTPLIFAAAMFAVQIVGRSIIAQRKRKAATQDPALHGMGSAD